MEYQKTLEGNCQALVGFNCKEQPSFLLMMKKKRRSFWWRLRNSTEIKKESSMSLLGRGCFSTKIRLAETLSWFDYVKVEESVRSKDTRIRSEKCMT